MYIEIGIFKEKSMAMRTRTACPPEPTARWASCRRIASDAIYRNSCRDIFRGIERESKKYLKRKRHGVTVRDGCALG